MKAKYYKTYYLWEEVKDTVVATTGPPIVGLRIKVNYTFNQQQAHYNINVK